MAIDNWHIFTFSIGQDFTGNTAIAEAYTTTSRRHCATVCAVSNYCGFFEYREIDKMCLLSCKGSSVKYKHFVKVTL